MFGKSYNGIIGTDLFFFKTEVAEYMTYFVFQAMFVATAATIISGAVAERMKFNGYLIITVLLSIVFYIFASFFIKAFKIEDIKLKY